jgi:hypothetical protein
VPNHSMRLPKLLASFAPEAIIGSCPVSLFPDPNDGNILKPYPIITFGRRTDAPNLTYSVESSHDLVNWANDVEQVSATPGPAPNMALRILIDEGLDLKALLEMHPPIPAPPMIGP